MFPEGDWTRSCLGLSRRLLAIGGLCLALAPTGPAVASGPALGDWVVGWRVVVAVLVVVVGGVVVAQRVISSLPPSPPPPPSPWSPSPSPSPSSSTSSLALLIKVPKSCSSDMRRSLRGGAGAVMVGDVERVADAATGTGMAVVGFVCFAVVVGLELGLRGVWEEVEMRREWDWPIVLLLLLLLYWIGLFGWDSLQAGGLCLCVVLVGLI